MNGFVCRFCNLNYTRKESLTRHLKENRCAIAKCMSPLDYHNIILKIEKEKKLIEEDIYTNEIKFEKDKVTMVMFVDNGENLYDNYTEEYFQKQLELYFGNGHKKTKFGEIDIETNDSIIEIKKWSKWKQVVGQLIAYSDDSPNKIKKAFFFGNKYPKEKQDNIVNLLNRHNIEVYDTWVQDFEKVDFKKIN